MSTQNNNGRKIIGSVAGTGLILFSLIFLFIGAIFLAIASAFSKIAEEQGKTYLPTEAVITEIKITRNCEGETSYHPYIKYTVDGKEYNTELDFYSSSMHEGQTITILYHPEKPTRIVYEEGYELFTTIFGVCGWIMLFVGAVPFVAGIVVIIISFRKPKNPVEITGGSDGPTAVFVSRTKEAETTAPDYSENYRKKNSGDRYDGLGEGIE